jgi:excisionase family DNA binding protein
MAAGSLRRLYTVVEAAQLLGLGRSTMYELVRRGEIASVRLGRKLLITPSTLEALLGCVPPTPAEMAEQSIGKRATRRPHPRGAVPVGR